MPHHGGRRRRFMAPYPCFACVESHSDPSQSCPVTARVGALTRNPLWQWPETSMMRSLEMSCEKSYLARTEGSWPLTLKIRRSIRPLKKLVTHDLGFLPWSVAELLWLAALNRGPGRNTSASLFNCHAKVVGAGIDSTRKDLCVKLTWTDRPLDISLTFDLVFFWVLRAMSTTSTLFSVPTLIFSEPCVSKMMENPVCTVELRIEISM